MRNPWKYPGLLPFVLIEVAAAALITNWFLRGIFIMFAILFVIVDYREYRRKDAKETPVPGSRRTS